MDIGTTCLNAFTYLMTLCVGFQMYKFNVWGFQVSILEMGIFMLLAETLFTFISRIFGKMEVEVS